MIPPKNHSDVEMTESKLVEPQKLTEVLQVVQPAEELVDVAME